MTPGTPLLVRRTSEVNIDNFDQAPLVKYYRQLRQKIPQLEVELAHLRSVLQKQQEQIKEVTTEQIEEKYIEISELQERKQLISRYCQLTRDQIQNIIEKTGYMNLQVMQITSDEAVEKILEELYSRYQYKWQPVPEPLLSKLGQMSDCFLVNARVRGESLLKLSDFKSPGLPFGAGMSISVELVIDEITE